MTLPCDIKSALLSVQVRYVLFVRFPCEFVLRKKDSYATFVSVNHWFYCFLVSTSFVVSVQGRVYWVPLVSRVLQEPHESRARYCLSLLVTVRFPRCV